MAQWPHLNKAPIAEALIDLRVKLPSGTDLAIFKPFEERIRNAYPTRRERVQWQGQFRFGPGDSSEQSSQRAPHGYFFDSEDKKQIVQARLDGFTFSRLRPYQDWASLQTEARRLWEVYREVAQPEVVTRVAVRYINRIVLPLPIVNLGDWFVTRPEMPGFFGKASPGFFMRLVAEFKDVPAKAIVTFLIEQGAQDAQIPFVLDIDVFRGQEYDPASLEIWDLLKDLRSLKNNIFFESISKRLMRELEPVWTEKQQP